MSEMNEVIKTMCDHLVMPIPKEPLNYINASKASVSYSNEGNYISMRVWGDKFKGGVIVKYNSGTDLYDVEFIKVINLAVKTVNKREGIYFDELAQYLWNETFIV